MCDAAYTQNVRLLEAVLLQVHATVFTSAHIILVPPLHKSPVNTYDD